MNDHAQMWADPRLVYAVAAAAVALLLVTIWLFKRKRREGRPAAVICLVLSIGLHAVLLWFIPMLPSNNGGSTSVDSQTDPNPGIDAIAFSTFDPDMTAEDAAGEADQSMIAPLPVSNLTDLVEPAEPIVESSQSLAESGQPPSESEQVESATPAIVPSSLAQTPTENRDDSLAEIDSHLSELLGAAMDPDPIALSTPQLNVATVETTSTPVESKDPTSAKAVASVQAPQNAVPGTVEADFANRTGQAKTEALLRTGGDADTEASVEAALRFLADAQRPDGAWDPRASGAGKERAPLGMTRGGAGARAETAITGLALLAMIGAGQTHDRGEYADNVYRGLAYLIQNQQPSGSLAGNASVYAANYSHGMASLAVCEAAAITRDSSAILTARRAIAHTQRMQHPTTGGWRYTKGDPGDLSQLGWQAMVLDAGHRSGIDIDARAIVGVQRFLRSVRSGRHGGLASYRPREAPSRTMTAEALATRLLIGEKVPEAEVVEAERYLLQQPPGVGQDNYYYWYYATLALHQLQDDAWQQWNEALKQRLLASQRSDGSWSADTMWGGYGGTVYTTSMAALCLETYYRHSVRSDDDRIANRER